MRDSHTRVYCNIDDEYTTTRAGPPLSSLARARDNDEFHGLGTRGRLARAIHPFWYSRGDRCTYAHSSERHRAVDVARAATSGRKLPSDYAVTRSRSAYVRCVRASSVAAATRNSATNEEEERNLLSSVDARSSLLSSLAHARPTSWIVVSGRQRRDTFAPRFSLGPLHPLSLESFRTTPGVDGRAFYSLSRERSSVVSRDQAKRPTFARTPYGASSLYGTKTTLSQAWSGNCIRGPQCAFEMSMFMCPAVHKLTRN